MGPIDDAGPVSVHARKTAEPSFKVNVYILYTDYIAQSGILRVEPVGDVLKDASLNSAPLAMILAQVKQDNSTITVSYKKQFLVEF